MIGKPYAGELQVRFDEGEQDFVLRSILNGHEAGKRWTQPRADLTNVAPVLYSTLPTPDPYLPFCETVIGELSLFIDEVASSEREAASARVRRIEDTLTKSKKR